MADEGKISMIACRQLEPAEQEKVEALDGPISQRLNRAGLSARICEGSGSGDERILDFFDLEGVVASVPAAKFLAAPDDEAVAMIEIVARS